MTKGRSWSGLSFLEAGDLDRGDRLAVALLFEVSALLAVLNHIDLLVAIVSDELAHNLGTFYIGSTNGDSRTIVGKEYVFEGDFVSCILYIRYGLNIEHHAFSDNILFASRLYNCDLCHTSVDTTIYGSIRQVSMP